MSRQHAAQALALVESSPVSGETKVFGYDLPTDYAWALLAAGRFAEGAAQMEVATSPPPLRRALLRRMLVLPPKAPVTVAPLSLAYAWHLAHDDEKIARIDGNALRVACRRALTLDVQEDALRPWIGTRAATLREYAKHFCPDYLARSAPP